ncbi:hypothetical protein CMV_007864 [Castanea mollissima]|uniref:Uncharacterized protein n=1 Tax=Castanea mollissima TaxID=60419 RepID=A0A8J4RL34_9ROSI|nr:hypothetical protein CMV_007864 [Castanea mollissima]
MDYTNRWTSQQQQQQQISLNPNPNSNHSSSISQAQLYHYPLPQPSFSHLTNPNLFLSFPQPVLPSASDSLLHPPGTDPFANSGLYPSTHVGPGSHVQFPEDPNAASKNWVYKQAEPIRYDSVPASNSLHENSIASTSSNSLWNNYWTNQHLTNDATKIVPEQTKFVQSMRCEVCKIDCNSREVYEKHMRGKKHLRNLQAQVPRSSIDGQVKFGASGGAAGKDLGTKKRKLLNGDAAADSVRVCTICNVTCNSQEVFNKHLAGKRHASQAGLIALNGVGPYIAAVKSQISSTWKKFPVKNKVVQSAWCSVCKINCNSNDVYIKHLSGKKHQKNMEKQSKSKNEVSAPASNALPAPTNPIIGPVENPDANKGKTVAKNSSNKVAESQAPREDLETKKRKVLECGAAAGAVRTCTICNLVCNSQSVFNSHLAGQKHAAMVKKQAEAGIAMAAAGPQLITAT